MVVKLAPFSAAAIQHFVYLERPGHSDEPDGEGFAADFSFTRGFQGSQHLVPMAQNYGTVGVFDAQLSGFITDFVASHGEDEVFCGDPALQLTPAETALPGATSVRCSKTAVEAFHSIASQGEGAPLHSVGSHFHTFVKLRDELLARVPGRVFRAIRGLELEAKRES